MAHKDTVRGKPIELGDEPPLVMGDDDVARYTRKGVSLRWLFGAVVTAITSTALMGGALFAALDGRYVVRAEAATLGSAAQPRQIKAAKGDRVRPAHEAVSSRRVLEIATVVRHGDQRTITKRPYALVNASLVLDRKDIGDVPPFNASALATPRNRSADTVTDAISAQAVDGEITVSVSAFPLDGTMAFDDALELEDPEVERQVRGVAATPSDAATAFAEDEAFLESSSGAAANLVIIPENVSELIKSADVDDAQGSDTELIELVQQGDTLSKILVGSGVSANDVKAIDRVLRGVGNETLRPGQTLRIAFQLDDEGEEAQRRPVRFSIYQKERHVATVAMTDQGDFVPGEQPEGPPPVVRDLQVAAPEERTPSIYASLYQTAVDHELPTPVRDLLLPTFANDVDYNAPVRPGDSLTVLHAVQDADDGPAEVLYASLTAAGVARRFYRFKSGDGTVDYYDEDGRTGDKFLMRKPMERGVFRSGFGMRNHPILRRRRLHRGVDYAAPRGTKIYAAGDGVVKQAGWKAGYGRWVLIAHRNGYETGYAHQSKIEQGIVPGTVVKQGQVVGYVGSTGFSTGPHLHFEVHVNGRPVNPLKIRLRRGKELSGDALAAFQQERDRIDALLEDERMDVARR